MTDMFKNSVISKDDFFKNPNKVLTLFDQQQFYQSPAYPGLRTNNLLESADNETKNFALFFAQKLANEIFPGIYGFMIDVRFHINQNYNNDKLNQGWIHCDDASLAGIVYLSKEEFSLETGTSMFVKKTLKEFETKDFKSRQEFNLTGTATDQYLHDLENNHNLFLETIRVGNVYNRIVAYDARIFHRPNRYNLDCNDSRKSIVFFIRDFKREYTSKVNLNFNWKDV